MKVEIDGKQYVPEDRMDTEAVKWAIDLLEVHPSVKANMNSQFWLRRLANIVAGYRDYPPMTSKQVQEAMIGPALTPSTTGSAT